MGRVLGTGDATPLKFWVAVAPGSALQLDDVVVTTREMPGGDPVTVAGVVTEVRARQEGAQFASDVFLVADGVLPAQVQESAEVATTRADPEVYVPPWPGAPVRRAAGAERDRALCFDRMDRRVPVGLGRDGVPVYLDLDFLDGTRGAHVSISGISGVATKTSFALFLLHSLFRSGALGRAATNAKALVFSVKGRTCSSSTRRTAGSTTTPGRRTPASGCRPSRSPRWRSSPRPAPATWPAGRT